MAHNLNFNEQRKQYSMFSVGAAWHGLGQTVTEAKTSEEAIKLANLDFTVAKAHHVMLIDPEIKNNELEVGLIDTVNNYGLYRTDTNISLTKNGSAVTDSYKIVQNVEAFDFIDSLIGKEAIITTAGALGDGETVFITAKLNKNLIVGDIDVIDQYLLIVLNHSGAGSIKIKFTPVRVVCQNTLTSAHIADSLFSIKHIGDVKNKLQLASDILSESIKTSEILTEQFNSMSTVSFNNKDMQDFILKLFLARDQITCLKDNKVDLAYSPNMNILKEAEVSTKVYNIMNSIYTASKNGTGQNIITTENTLFGAVNAVSYYYSRLKDYSNSEKRFNSLTSGESFKKIKNATNLALQYL